MKISEIFPHCKDASFLHHIFRRKSDLPSLPDMSECDEVSGECGGIDIGQVVKTEEKNLFSHLVFTWWNRLQEWF